MGDSKTACADNVRIRRYRHAILAPTQYSLSAVQGACMFELNWPTISCRETKIESISKLKPLPHLIYSSGFKCQHSLVGEKWKPKAK
jgi:hypothetical protein